MRERDFFCAKIHKKTVPSTILEVFMDGHEISIKISFDFKKIVCYLPEKGIQ